MILQNIVKRLICNECTPVRFGAHSSSLRGALRTMLMLLILTLGTITVWGQVGTDRSGYYYIANHHNGGYRSNNSSVNYYLVPSDVVYHDWNAATPNQQPYLTTYKTNKDDNSRWKVLFVKTENNVDYYTIMHVSDKKYLTWNGTVNNNVDRVRVHLQKNYDEANALFFFTEGNKGTDDYNICSKDNKCSKNTIGSLNPAKNNYDDYGNVNHSSGAGTFTQGENTIYCDGLVGVYEQNDSRGVWYLEKYGGDVCKNPVIAYFGTTQMEITCPTSGATIYYKRHYVDNSQDDETWQSYDNNSKINVTNELVSVEAYAESPSDQSEVTTFNLIPEPPTITYDASTNEITISSNTPGANIYYTIDGNEATTSSTNSGITPITFSLSSDIMTIRTIAKKGGVTSSESTKVCIKLGSGNPYLLQSVECSDFYMTVGDVSGSNTTVNTSSLPQAGMSWYFEDAGTENGVQYYYVYNTSMGAYLQRNGTNLYLLTTNNNSDAFKFSVLPYYDGTTLAGYNLQSKANSYYVHKANGNGANNAVNLNANSYEARSRWNFILVANKNFTSLVTPFDNSNTTYTYYTLTSTAANTYLMVPPVASTGYVTTATGTTDNQKWYFQQAYTDEWATYYYILNAVTGEAIHFRGTESTSNQSDALEMTVLPATPDANYQFALAPTITSGECYIIPRSLAQFAKTNYVAVWREGTGGTLQTRNSRSDNKIKWQISPVENYVAPPYITYDITTNTATLSCTYPGATIYYTTDGSEATTISTNTIVPIAPSSTASTSFVLTADVTTIRAIASKGAGTSSESTYSVAFQLTLSDDDHRPYLIQSQNYNTSYVTWTEPCYYMIPSDVSNDNITVNTTTLLQPSMEWYFLNAGIESDVQYYYIVNNASKDNENHPYYLCYDSGVYMRVFDSDNANKFKFSIVQYPTTGTPTGFNLKPYGQTNVIHKSNGNNSANAVTLNNSNNSGASLWKFIKKSNLPASLPFSVSDNSKTYYYKLSTNAASDYFITPSTTNQYVTTYNTTSDNQNWYFEQVEAATNDDWLTYYHIRNAITGEYLYYNGEVNGNNHSNAFELHSSIGNETNRYKFAMTRAIYQDRWFIVPKVLKSTQFAHISTMWRDGTNPLKTQKTRDNGNAMWQFTVSNFCMPPFFEESNGNITISCDTKGAEIHYQATDDSNPTSASTLYNNDNWSSSDQVRIKAIAVVQDGETVTASSAVATLLNKPDITLEAGPYVYKGATWEPSLLTVSIGESGSETTALPATYTATYSNNVNVGTATVTLTDADPTDAWYILNGSTTFIIDQKAITITAASDTKGYDGTPLTNDGYTCSELATGDSFESVTVTGSQTDVGSGSNVPSAAVIKNESDEDMTANYTITYVNGTLVVTVRSIGDGTNPATGFSVSIGEGNTIILKDGEITLTQTIDYTDGDVTTSESGRYSSRTISGAGNYSGSFKVRNAIVNFQTDANEREWSATFVAEPAGADAPDDTKGHELPSGITAYIITSIEGDNANAEPLDYIPEGIPVLLLSNMASNGFFVQDASEHTAITSAQISNNMLEEVTDETPGYVSDSESANYQKAHFDTRTIYLLYNNEFVYNKGGYLAKGKVYLNPSHTAPDPDPAPSRLRIAWGKSSGIKESQLSPLTSHRSEWYTLDGRRLNGKPVKRGLYIMDGKKKFIK